MFKDSKDWVEAMSLRAKGAEDSRMQRLEDRVTLLEVAAQPRLAGTHASGLIDGGGYGIGGSGP